jgi:K+-sensing histidine kinase KdpD
MQYSLTSYPVVTVALLQMSCDHTFRRPADPVVPRLCRCHTLVSVNNNNKLMNMRASMKRLLGVLMLILALICVLAAVLTVINLGFILTRPDSISVVNTLIGQFVVIVGALVLARLLTVAGKARIKPSSDTNSGEQ